MRRLLLPQQAAAAAVAVAAAARARRDLHVPCVGSADKPGFIERHFSPHATLPRAIIHAYEMRSAGGVYTVLKGQRTGVCLSGVTKGK